MLGIVAASLLMLGIGTASLTPTKFAQKILLNHFTAILSGNNEVPPVSTTGSGIASFQLVSLGHQEAINYELNLKNMKGVTGAHIHIGKQGENGPVGIHLIQSWYEGTAYRNSQWATHGRNPDVIQTHRTTNW